MIRSRPGFATQIIDDSNATTHATPAAPLTPDMLPAIARHTAAQPDLSQSPLTQTVHREQQLNADRFQAKADAAHKKLLAEQAARKGPDILPSSAPSLPPITKNQDFMP